MANNSKVEGLTVLGEDCRGTRYDLGGGWVRTVGKDGAVSDSFDKVHAKRSSEDFEREERQAWDMYAAAALQSFIVVKREEVSDGLYADSPIEQEFTAYGADLVATAMLERRRKRFGGVR